MTFTVVEWVDVFTRKEYKDILIDNLRYCQKEKGLTIYGWCLMSNHVHLVVSTKTLDVSDLLRDFKKYTAKKIIEYLINNVYESRKEWMLKVFRQAGANNSRNANYQFWRQENQPKIIYTPAFAAQKLEYIHNNPVEAGIVTTAEEYLYSSARDYFEGRQCGLLEIEFLI